MPIIPEEDLSNRAALLFARGAQRDPWTPAQVMSYRKKLLSLLSMDMMKGRQTLFRIKNQIEGLRKRKVHSGSQFVTVMQGWINFRHFVDKVDKEWMKMARSY